MGFQSDMDWAMAETQSYAGEPFIINGRTITGVLSPLDIDPDESIAGHSMKSVATLVAPSDQFPSRPVPHTTIIERCETGLRYSVTSVNEDNGDYTLNLVEITV